MNTTLTSRTRTIAATVGLGAVLLGATGCSALSLPTGSEYDKTQGYDFKDLQDSNAQKVLPSWTPEDATNIKEEQRTTGNERLLVMDVATNKAPGTCKALKTPGKPTASEIERGLVAEGASRSEAADEAAQQYTTPLLEADWWPRDQQENATHLCGKWWVSVEDGKLYAYSPESQTIADGVKDERSAKK
ncbi:hypothetical protein [Arthrobacter sp.]|uniref:hypothetical protein n=1 Tax=Arthrobacter sp. TaxID=1667 RepID=UPI003A9319E2